MKLAGIIIITLSIICFFMACMLGARSGQPSYNCTNTTVYINQTVEMIREVPAACQECPAQTVCPRCEVYDAKELTKCRLQNARLIAEANYYKNVTSEYFSNKSIEELETNYSACIIDRDSCLTKLRAINNTFQ